MNNMIACFLCDGTRVLTSVVIRAQLQLLSCQSQVIILFKPAPDFLRLLSVYKNMCVSDPKAINYVHVILNLHTKLNTYILKCNYNPGFIPGYS